MGDFKLNCAMTLHHEDLMLSQKVDSSALVSIEKKHEETEQEQSTVLEAAQRAAKAVGGLVSLWISQACLAEAVGAATAFAASSAAAGTAVSGAGVIVFTTAAAATCKLGVDLISGKSLKESFDDTASTAKHVSKKIFGFITSPMQAVKESFTTTTLPLAHDVKLLALASPAA